MLDGLFKRRAAITSPCLACPSQRAPNDDDWRHLPKGIIYLSPSQTIKVNLLTKKTCDDGFNDIVIFGAKVVLVYYQFDWLCHTLTQNYTHYTHTYTTSIHTQTRLNIHIHIHV